MTTYPPYWNAFNREAALASEAVSSGLESLRKADYANPGLYTFAFFGLANGLERLFKIVYVIDYAVNNSGEFPNNETLKGRMGHDLNKLYGECSKLRDVDGKHYVNETLKSHLKQDIIDFLSEFAKYTRYYNLNLITENKKATSDRDPLSRWFVDIGDKIRSLHYSEKMRMRDMENARKVHDFAQQSMPHVVLHVAEDGTPMSDMYTASLQTGRTKFMQKYGTFYCAVLCRYAYRMLFSANMNAFKNGVMVPFMYEHFFPFENDDEYLLGRKTFTPRVRQR